MPKSRLLSQASELRNCQLRASAEELGRPFFVIVGAGGILFGLWPDPLNLGRTMETRIMINLLIPHPFFCSRKCSHHASNQWPLESLQRCT